MKEYKVIYGWLDNKDNKFDDQLNKLAKEGFVVEHYRNHGDSYCVSVLMSREVKE